MGAVTALLVLAAVAAAPVPAEPSERRARAQEPRQRPTLEVRDYVLLPRASRCARTVGARPRAGAGVERITLAIGQRTSAGKRPRLGLRARRTRVTVTVELSGGAVAIETLTYRRCA
jgi:hypothetical protein